ncbi:MAG: hypothetical protein IJW95_03130 [Clostridia bacterium]|nr:hypothetical protein [Clostridia bacterium]
MANTTVRHRLYGIGEIVKQMEDKITVQFGGNVGEKSFLYPDAFSGHLRYEDPLMQSVIEAELRDRDAAAKRAAEEREQLRLENMAAEKLRQKQMAAAKKRSNAQRAGKRAPQQ